MKRSKRKEVRERERKIYQEKKREKEKRERYRKKKEKFYRDQQINEHTPKRRWRTRRKKRPRESNESTFY